MKSTFTHFRPARSLLAAVSVASLLSLAAVVQAQGYTGPRTEASASRQGYTGPSSLSVTTVKQLLDHGRDDQKAVLRGRIVSWDGGKHYTFDDGTGQIRLEISARRFPRDLGIDDNTTVELYGELEKDRRGVEFEVDRIRIP